MAHHLDYLQLTWYVSVGLGVFKLLSQFAIKLIAIFAREKFSERAFEVLRINWLEHAFGIFRSRTGESAACTLCAEHPDPDGS